MANQGTITGMIQNSYQLGSKQRKRRQCGFTLLEMLVVLFIMSVLTAAALNQLRLRFNVSPAKTAAEDFMAHYQSLYDEALLRRQHFFYQLQDNQLIAYTLDTKTQAKQVVYQLSQAGLDLVLDPSQPIHLYPSGQSTPFQITFTAADEHITVSGDALGQVLLKNE